MALDRVFSTPTITVDQDKYDGLIRIKDRCKQLIKKGKKENMNFGEALDLLKKGKRVTRKGWNGKGIFIELQRPDENSKMTHSYIYIDTTGLQTDNPHAPKDRVPWLASQTDMLAEDWKIVNESEEN